MRAALALLLASCATSTAVVKPPVAEAPPAPEVPACPLATVTYSEASASELRTGAMVEKVCLLGASEDSYLRLHELVAPREGSPLELEVVRADIEALFTQGLLRDVVVVAQALKSRGVVLSYVVSEYEWITEVDYTGVTAVKIDDFKEIAHAGVRANPFVVKALSDTVKALYAGMGFPAARVVTTVKSLGGGNAGLTLTVEEGPRVTVGAISFEGVKQVSEAELRKALRSSVGVPYLEDLVERDTLALTTVYFDHGMVNVAVVNSTRTLAVPVGAVELVFQVKEGEVFRLGKVTLKGFSIGAEKDVLKSMEARSRSVFSRSVLQRDMERIRARAELLGIIVEITPLTTIDTEKKTIDIAFELEKKSSAAGKIRF